MKVTLQNYEEERRKLVEINANLSGVVLREPERRLNERLTQWKRDYREACHGHIPYDMPVLTDKVLQQSDLYRFCRDLPKGGDLHVHDMSLLPVRELVPLLCTHPEFCIRTDRPTYELIIVDPSAPVPPGYTRFAEAVRMPGYTPDDLVPAWTVAGVSASGQSVWDYFEELFCRHDVLSNNPSFAADYYVYTFRYYCRRHIQHVEIHLMLTDSIDESAAYLRVIRQAYYTVKQEYPFFTVRVIGAGVKADNDGLEMTKKCFLNTTYVQELIKDESDPHGESDFVIGFDIVNEEDSSLPLHAFAPMLLKAKKQYPSMKLYIHGGESLSADNENLIDAYLLGVSRVGHGFNLYRYPDLHARYAQAEICLEVCPISNRALEYVKDIRNHPATEYLRTGVALALCSDDPTYMENETLTDDFFAAVVGWDLDLADIKQLGINSLMYSGLTSSARSRALKDYGKLWNDFVERTLLA